jgi:hypothetical protein
MYKRVSYYYYRKVTKKKILGPDYQDLNIRYNNPDSVVVSSTDIDIATCWSSKFTTFPTLLKEERSATSSRW